ncbi:MAG: carbohydrate ABC transporter permease [Chloroflexi bacterium]|nr:carbohydrate ABC transporter permease [Chloroflexota bacterium]
MKSDPVAPPRPHWPGAALRHLTLFGLSALALLPLLWMVSSSLRAPGLPPPQTIEWLPEPAAWGNYLRIFRLVPLGRYALNSLAVVGLAVPITVVTASWAGFALARLNDADRRSLVRYSLILLMVPVTAVWLGRFLIFKQMGLINSLWALAAPAFMGTSPFFVLLFYWTYRRLPPELYESAHLDGASAFGVWRVVAAPLSCPTAAVVALLTFVIYWSDFISPLLYLSTPARYTLPVGLQLLQQMDRSDYPLLMAASVLMVMPVVLVFAAAHRLSGRLSGPTGA